MDLQGKSRVGESNINTLKSLPATERVNLSPPEFMRVADLSFKPDKFLPAHRRPATLLISAQGPRVTGSVIMGRYIFHGTGEIVSSRGGQVLQFASMTIGVSRAASLTFTLPWKIGRADGVFAYRLGRRGGGGVLKGVWWQGGEDAFFKECGKFISAQTIECSDPGGAHKSKFNLYHYEKCDFIMWLDADDKPIRPAIKLTNDGPGGKSYTKGGVTITPLSRPLASHPVGATEKRSGQLRIFYVTGCKDARVVQYVKSTVTFKPPPSDPSAKMPKDVTNDWHLDSADPYPGAQKNDEGHTISSDIPAAYESEVAAAADVKTIPKGATVTYKWVLETFVYCDGKLLAWITWGGSVTFTMGDGGKLTPGAPDVDVPKFHGPDEFSKSAGNPKK